MNTTPSSSPAFQSPAFQPTSRPRNQSIAYTEFLYVSLALILLIVLICLIMCGLKRLCHKKSVCDRLCGRYDVDENQDVEVIVETVAVVDNSNYAECDFEGGYTSQSGRHGQGQGQGRDSMRDRGSLKRYGSWFGYGPQRNGQSLAVAQEYQGNSAIVLGLAAPMRVMDTFQDLNDYNTNNVARARLTLLSTLPTNNTPASRTAAATLDSRDVVIDDAVSRAYGGDHDYLIETERNMGEVNDQFMRFTAAHNLNLGYNGNREGGTSSREGGTGVGTETDTRAGTGAGEGSVGSPNSSRQFPGAVIEHESSSTHSPSPSSRRTAQSSSSMTGAVDGTCYVDALEGMAGETGTGGAASYRPLCHSCSRASSVVVEEVKEEDSSASSLSSLNGIVVDADDYNSNFCRLPPLQPLGTLSSTH